MQTENELPMLAGLAEFFHWWEEFLNIINGPVLLFGAGIALVDLLTDGKLTTTYVVLLFAWAISQALGIDTQLLGSFARARRKHGWERVGWLVVGVILGVATWQAGDVYAIQQSEHISEAAALAQLGMPRLTWLGWRTFLAVGLVALNGWTRYRAPAKATLADEREKLERELTLEPMRQRLRMQQVGGIRTLAQTALGGAGVAQDVQTAIDAPTTFEATGEPHTATQEAQQTASSARADTPIAPDRPEKPPTGPGSPSMGSNRTPRKRPAPVLRLTPERTRTDKRTAARANARSGKRGAAEQRVRAILAQEPGIDFEALVQRANVSRSTASKYQAVWFAEGHVSDGLAQ